MKTGKKQTIGKGLTSKMKFNLDMDSEVQKALKDAGLDQVNTSVFPDLKVLRDKIDEHASLLSASQTIYDHIVSIKDAFIQIEDSNDLRLRIYRPDVKGEILPVLYWMHSGGMMGGLPEQDDPQMKQIAVEARALVISVDYRLAPEFPYPTPLNDCYYGLLWTVENAKELGIDISKIAVGGASAGGGLAAALTLKVRKDGGPQIVHQSLTYPMLDDRNKTNSSYQVNSLGAWDRAYNIFGWKSYLGAMWGKEKISKLAAPARAKNLVGLPPTFIAVGSLDLFRDEDIEYALRLMEAGVSTDLHFYHGLVHGFDWYIPKSCMTLSLLQKRIHSLKVAFLNHN